MTELTVLHLVRLGLSDGVLLPGGQLRSISGHIIKTLGIVSIYLFDTKCEFFVVKDLKYNFLLGTDVMLDIDAQINYKNKTVRLHNKNYSWVVISSNNDIVSGVTLEIDYWRKIFPEIFPNSEEKLKATTVIQMHINTSNAHPVNQRAYRVPLKKRVLIEKEINAMIDNDIIEASNSPWASPITIVPKKDGSIRLCGDYRKLNNVTVKDAYPLPCIQDIFDQLNGAKIFTTIDLKSGYWQIEINENSREKTAITTHMGLFQFKRMQFGLTNAPAVFQRFMNSIFTKLIGKCCLIYLDDIVIYSKNENEHSEHIAMVLTVLRDNGMTIKESKCTFAASEVKLLGYVVGAEGLKPDPVKVSAIKDMAAPTNRKQVRRLLGSVGYYRQLIVNYADIAAPITKLTSEKIKFNWTVECERAWDKLKIELLNCVVLKFPDPQKPYKLYTDASEYSLGAILVQADDDNIDRPVQFISARFTDAQKNYPTIEKEAYAIIFSLIKLRPYLFGAKFTIFTDHAPLKCFFTKEIKNTRIQRWAVLLAEFSAPIEYIKGKSNVWADMLSRLRPTVEATEPLEMEGVEDLLPEHVVPFEHYSLSVEEILLEQKKMPEYILGQNNKNKYLIFNNLLYSYVAPTKKDVYPRLVLPCKYRQKVMDIAHVEVGHMSVSKTLVRLQENFRWSGMTKDVYNFVALCPQCVVNRVGRDRPAPQSMPLPVCPGMVVAADLTGPFPMGCNGNKYLLSIIDHCTGWVEVKAIPDKSAKGIHDFIFDEYIPRHSIPNIFITDNGLEFKNKLIMDHFKEIGVSVHHTTPYHPQSNGMIERYHRTLKSMFKKLTNSRGSRWETYLPDAIYAFRTVPSDSTGFSPFYLTYGRNPGKGHSNLINRAPGNVISELAYRVDELSINLKKAVENRLDSRKYNIARTERKANADALQVGDKVMLLVNEPGPLDRRFDPGFIVVRARKSVVTVVGPKNVRKVVNREQVKRVSGSINWDTLPPRLTRTERQKDSRGLLPCDPLFRKRVFHAKPTIVNEQRQEVDLVRPIGTGPMTRAQARRQHVEFVDISLLTHPTDQVGARINYKGGKSPPRNVNKHWRAPLTTARHVALNHCTNAQQTGILIFQRGIFGEIVNNVYMPY